MHSIKTAAPGPNPTHTFPGFCVWLTGLSGAGKSTTARALRRVLLQRDYRVVLLDGDEIRSSISRDLGFSKADRDANVMRVAAVAKEATERGEISICALVSPYRTTRNRVRQLLGQDLFFEVFVDTPLSVCEGRDTKGLYARARRGELSGFTGIDDPYERPSDPDLVLDTVNCTIDENIARVIELLVSRALLTRRDV